MDNDKFLINVNIADKSYSLWINRDDEAMAREAAKQIYTKIAQYGRVYDKSSVDTKDLLAMTALQLSINNLQLEEKNDTAPFEDKIQQLNDELGLYLKDKM